MPLNFPSSPVDKQVYVYASTGAQYVYDAANTRWTTNTFISNVVSGYYGSAYDTANAAFDTANNALPNVSNAVFNGNLRVTGNLLIGTNTVTIRDNHIISAEYFRMNTANHMAVIPDGNRVNTLYTLVNTSYDSANSIASGSITINNISLSGNINPGTVSVVSQTLTDSANISWNMATAAVASVTLGGNRYMDTPTNLKVGTLVLHVNQDSTGGRTLTWSPVFKWPAGVAPVLTSTGSRKDIFSFICDGTNLYGSYLPDVR
jgi:hypothetical protein